MGEHDHRMRKRGKIVLIGFLLVASFFLITEHTAHFLGVLPSFPHPRWENRCSLQLTCQRAKAVFHFYGKNVLKGRQSVTIL